MNVKTGKCLCCDITVYECSLSLRGWCIACEREFKRITTQRDARTILQLEMQLDALEEERELDEDQE